MFRSWLEYAITESKFNVFKWAKALKDQGRETVENELYNHRQRSPRRTTHFGGS